MKYQLNENQRELNIEIKELAGGDKKLIKLFQACQEGRCHCPTDEYMKMESLEIQSGEDSIQLHFKPKSGASFDTSEIDKCLRNAVAKCAHSKISSDY